MTLHDLSLEYAQTAACRRRRITQLEGERKRAQDEGRRVQLDRRIRPLRSMYRDVRAVERHLTRYYDRTSIRERRPRP